MDLSYLFEALVHYRLIRGIVGFCYQDRVPMVSALVCNVFQVVLLDSKLVRGLKQSI